jgi:formylglycine-generating enzyme required for sulfatase activity
VCLGAPAFLRRSQASVRRGAPYELFLQQQRRVEMPLSILRPIFRLDSRCGARIFTGDGMERQVFVSHAKDDPEWPPDQVEAVALAIQQAGIGVSLDHWHQRDAKRHLSLSEWRDWMDAAIRGSSHILCLTSPHYLRLWERRPEDAGGFGVAFESIRLIHGLYLLKQRSHGRILTLRPEDSDYDCIPPDLVLDCPAYRWAADRDMLLSHVGEAALHSHVVPQGRPSGETLHQSPRLGMQVAQTPAPTAQPRLPWASDSGEDGYGRWADLTVNGVTQRMRWIPPTGPEGFWMGSPQAERNAIKDKDVREWANHREHAPRREIVEQGFWLADTPCTQAFWRAVADVDPSHFGAGPEAPQRPVENVSWDTVMDQFIARFAARPDWGTGKGLRLPTEVEWEYAARAGTRTAYWWGDAWDAAHGNANKAFESTTSVKRYKPNSWGLYDVHGNVYEWCADVWRDRRDAPEARPDDSFRVVRGGSWSDLPDYARAASCSRGPRWFAHQTYGFRFALRSSSGPAAGGGGGGRSPRPDVAVPGRMAWPAWVPEEAAPRWRRRA